jgi:hypothetical protein
MRMGVIMALMSGFLLLTLLGLLGVVTVMRVPGGEPRPPRDPHDLVGRARLLDDRVLTRLREAYQARSRRGRKQLQHD